MTGRIEVQRSIWCRTVVAALVLVLLLPATAVAAPSTPDRVYFPQTGHYLAYGFLDYWLEHGGIPIFGYPISEEFQQNGLTVQYFERAVFEYHPNNPEPYKVEQRRLGALATAGLQGQTPFQPLPATTGSDANCTFYTATNHRLCFGFRDYWQQHGGLPVFGYPISEEFTENGYTVQYFERARFEYHPNNPPAYQVELGLLGDQAAQQDGVNTTPLGQSASVPAFDLSLWPRCRTAQLQAALGSQGFALGHVVAVITLQNTSASTCTLDGYPGMQLLDAHGNPLPTTVNRRLDAYFNIPNVSPQEVFLLPGGTASFNVTYGDNPSGTETSCPISSQAEVTPPNAYHQLLLPAQFAACGGQLGVSPVIAGAGGVPRGD